jgi:hypothetical protein
MENDTTPAYAAIGKVAVAFGRLETALAELADRLVNPKEPWTGQAFTTDVRVSRLIDAILWLYEQRGGSRQSELKLLLNRILELSKKRNEILHADWIIEPVSGFPAMPPIRKRTELQSRKGPSHSTEMFTESELTNIAGQISKATSELYTFIKEIWESRVATQ